MESKVILLLLLIILITLPYSQGVKNEERNANILIYEVSPYPYPKTHMEYVCIINPSNRNISLNGYYITDFEGKLMLHGYIKPHSKIYIGENISSFFRFMGFYPNYTYSKIKEGNFLLANKGDEVALYHNSKMIDIVIYGKSKYNGTGWKGESVKITQGHIIRRYNLIDTNSSKDWSNYHTIGQSDFKPVKFKSSIEIFPYPDKRGEVLRFISNAHKYILVETYTMSSMDFEKTLERKISRGVKIDILLEGSPVGGINDAEKYIIQRLYNKGATIKLMINNPREGIYDRYSFIHAKFIIVDGIKTLISTENFGVSLSPCGNRGYGVIVRNKNFTEYMENVFYDDFKNVQDIKEYSGYFENISWKAESKVELRRGTFSSINLTVWIEPILAPDFSPTLFRDFIAEQKNIKIEALYIDRYVWNMVKNKTSYALVEYPRSGENVRKFDGFYHNIPYLHAKLMIGDSSIFVGSMNFGISSITKNREVSLIIKSPTAANYLSKIFQYDWVGEYKPVAVCEIHRTSYGITIDMSKSLGEIKEYMVYVDGKIVYHGKNPTYNLKMNNGVHKIKIVVVDKWNNESEIEESIDVQNEGFFDMRILIFLIFVTFFLYKVWKNHG
jgi:phosphatidylserine/phosphatidylglycerophosphate/cardiolipin synthase-like enzyme